MTRPQIENSDADAVDLTPWAPANLPGGIGIRVLNHDPGNGAVSGVLEAPAGWSWPASGCCAADQEFFVLEGAIRIGDHVLGNGCFCYYPKGVLQAGWEVLEDCRIFAMFDREPVFAAASASMPAARVELTVEFVDSWAMDWENPLDASDPSAAFRPGIFVKVLRQDPDTGTSTHLAGLMPGWYAEGIEVHPVREESLIISGDVNIGMVAGKPGYTVKVGGYYDRPPGVPHGPLASKNGNVGIVHTEGLLGIDYRDDDRAPGLVMSHLRGYPWR